MANRMLKKTWLIRGILIIAVLALVGTALSCSPSDPSKALDFTLPTLTGASITLSELEGTPVVLNFWSTGSPPCVSQMPFLESVAQQSGGEIKVIAINVGESAATVQEFFGNNETTMIVALDENREIFEHYCQHSNNPQQYIPLTLFVDSEGIVQHIRIGSFSSEEELWNTLDSVF